MKQVILFLAAFATALLAAPPVSTPAKYAIEYTKYDFIDSTLNYIQFPKGKDAFETFFKKMDSLVFENKGKVKIMHIGGSHLQADVISGRIRDRLVKEYPGSSAGRGLPAERGGNLRPGEGENQGGRRQSGPDAPERGKGADGDRSRRFL